MTKQEAIELENRCDELMSQYLEEKCNVYMTLSGMLKVVFGDNYITLDQSIDMAAYIQYHGHYEDLVSLINLAFRCVNENKAIFDELVWSYEHLSEIK